MDIEYNHQMQRNVLKSDEYFNLSINSKSSFAKAGYGTFKHSENPSKVIRLPVDDPLVLNGTYVGATKGYKTSDETKKKISEAQTGENNGFYGKTHSDEVKLRIGDMNRGRIKSEETIKKLSDALKGRKFTEEHKQKIGRKGFYMLTHIDTRENIRIHRDDRHLYDENIWINIYKAKSINCELRTGYSNLKNIHTGENLRVDKEDLHKYDRSIWISPQAYAKLIKGN